MLTTIKELSTDSTEALKAPDLSQSYTEIKEDLEQQEQQQQPEEDAHQGLEERESPEDRPRPEDIQELDTQKDSDPPSKTQPKRKPRQRKDVTCDTCGKTYSSKTKSHKCVPPTEFVKVTAPKESPPSSLPPSPLPPSPPLPPPPAQREITIDDVRGFLVKEKAAKTEHRRNTWISSLF